MKILNQPCITLLYYLYNPFITSLSPFYPSILYSLSKIYEKIYEKTIKQKKDTKINYFCIFLWRRTKCFIFINFRFFQNQYRQNCRLPSFPFLREKKRYQCLYRSGFPTIRRFLPNALNFWLPPKYIYE